MTNTTLSYIFALSANLIFALASFVFAEYSRKISVLWMNCFKAAISLLALVVTLPFYAEHLQLSTKSSLLFFTSGLIALNIGDLCLLRAFAEIGPARTLMLFGFSPLILGVSAFYLFNQVLNPYKLFAIIALIGCLITFSLERYKISKQWQFRGLAFAILGVLLDCAGALLNRSAFELTPAIQPLEAHLWRCLGACFGFVVINYLFQPVVLFKSYFQLPKNKQKLVFVASLAGTYLSILLGLYAIQLGTMAAVAGIAITGPIFSAIFECFVEKKYPSKYLLVAFAFFAVGFTTLILTD